MEIVAQLKHTQTGSLDGSKSGSNQIKRKGVTVNKQYNYQYYICLCVCVLLYVSVCDTFMSVLMDSSAVR